MNKKGQLGALGGGIAVSFFVIIFILSIGFIILENARDSLITSQNAAVNNRAVNQAINIPLSLGNNKLSAFNATNSTNETNVVGTGNYTIDLAAGTFTITNAQFASQPINISYVYTTKAQNAAGNLSEQGLKAGTNAGSLAGVLGTIVIAVVVIGVVVGLYAYVRND